MNDTSRQIEDGIYFLQPEGSAWIAAKYTDGKLVGNAYEADQSTHQTSRDEWANVYPRDTDEEVDTDEATVIVRQVMGENTHVDMVVVSKMVDTTVTLRVWDDGCSETIECEAGDDYEALAQEAWDGADYGEGDYCVTVSWEATDADGDYVDSGSFDLVGTTEEPACPAADEHDWTSEFEPGLKENPGVWSVGGTAMVFTARCRCCGMQRTERHTGSQRNPGECDTTEYSEPDAEWVAEHDGRNN
jgi:hypothetical protein